MPIYVKTMLQIHTCLDSVSEEKHISGNLSEKTGALFAQQMFAVFICPLLFLISKTEMNLFFHTLERCVRSLQTI